MNAPQRRGTCPGLSAPMPTGDGLLVRLMPTAPVPLDAFVAFCEAARQHGNGTIEISARGSLQVRGLTPRSAPLLAAAVAAIEIAAHEGVSVIAGLDPAIHQDKVLFARRMDTRVKPAHDTADVVAGLRRVLEDTRFALSPKVSVVVDGDGHMHLDAVSADIRLRAGDPAQQRRFHVGLGGDGASAAWLGSIAPDDAVDTVLGLLTIIAAHGSAARATDILRTEGVEAFRSVLEAFVAPSSAPPRRTPAEMIGPHPVHDGTLAVGIGLAFGHAHADALAELARIVAARGVRALRPAPDRTLLLIGVSASDVTDLATAAEQLGFVVRAADSRRRIVACPGSPACSSGLIPARALAAALAPHLASTSGGISVHISGCPKGCAHPRPAALTVVGTERGCGIVHDDSARATPASHVEPSNLAAEISRITAPASEAAHG